MSSDVRIKKWLRLRELAIVLQGAKSRNLYTLLSVPSKVERLLRRCVMAVTAFVTIAMITSRSLFSAAAAALALSAALPVEHGGKYESWNSPNWRQIRLDIPAVAAAAATGSTALLFFLLHAIISSRSTALSNIQSICTLNIDGAECIVHV